MGYIYNNLGQLIKTCYPDNLGQVYGDSHPAYLTVYNYYDNLGNLNRTINRKSETINYLYNEFGQVITIDLPVSTDIKYYYNKLGQLVKVEQQGKYSKLYTYDKRSRLGKETLTIDPGTTGQKIYTTEYKYNKNNAVTDIIYPASAGTMQYSYDELNRINNVQWLSTAATTLASNPGYTLTGQLSSLTYGNNVTGSFNYTYKNGAYVVDNITYAQGAKQLGVYDYRYDKLGNIIRANHHQYEYDDIGQLTGWKYLQDNNRACCEYKSGAWRINCQRHHEAEG